MAKNLQVQISFTGDSTELVEALDKLKKKLKQVESANKQVANANKQVEKSSDAATDSIKNNSNATDDNSRKKKKNKREGDLATKSNRLLKRSFATLRSEILLASFAFGTIGSLVGKFISLSNQQEDAEKRLQTALGFRSQLLLDGASALQEQTRFGDEQIIQAQALIAAFVDEEDAILKATAATLDLASAKNMDLNAAADLVSKSIGSSTNALTRYGIQVSGAVGSTERLESAVNGIAKAFGQTASQDAQTFGGQLDQLQNRLGDFGEDIGDVQKQKFRPLLDGLNNLSKGLVENKKAATIAAGGLLVLAGGFTAMVSGGIIRVLIGSIGALISNFRTLALAVRGGGRAVAQFFKRVMGKKGASQIDDVAKEVVPFGEKIKNLFSSFLQTASAGGIFVGTVKILSNETSVAAEEAEKLAKAQERLRIRNEVAASALKSTAEEQLKANILLESGTSSQTTNNKALFKTMQEIERITGQDIVLNADKIAQLGLHATMVEGLTDKEKELFNTRLALNEQTIAGSISDEKALQLRTAALAQFGSTLAGLRPESKGFALLSVRLSQIQAVADAYGSFNRYMNMSPPRPGLASLALAQGLANAATIEKQAGKVRGAEIGADFVTQGFTRMEVGEAGAERVQVTPLGMNSRAGAGGMRNIEVNLNGNVVGTEEFLRDELIPAIENSLERNLA
jgi:hypothetical protein